MQSQEPFLTREIFWNWPNICTHTRLVFGLLSVLFLYHQAPLAAFFFYLVAPLTDFLDGYLARKLHQETQFGAMYDSVADKFTNYANLIFFALLYRILIIPTWLAVGLGMLLMISSILAKTGILSGYALKANRFGKLKYVSEIAALVLLFLYHLHWWKPALSISVYVLYLFSIPLGILSIIVHKRKTE